MDQLQRLIVKGRSAGSQYIPLTPLDIYLGHYITGGAYFFQQAPDIERLKNALTVAIDRHPTFGACMVREASNIGLDCGSTGAELLIHRSDLDCPNLRSTESLITEALLVDARTSDYQTAGYSFNSGRPVASFQLTLFNDGRCALLIRHVHSQADGASAVHFLQNWSRAYRGLPLSLPSGYSRMHVGGLATMPGLAPSRKLNIQQRSSIVDWATAGRSDIHTARNHVAAAADNYPHNIDFDQDRDGGSIRVDIPGAALDNLVHDCRRSYHLALTSSEILHALTWQCFAKACVATAQGSVAGQDSVSEQHTTSPSERVIRQNALPLPITALDSVATHNGEAIESPNLRLYTLFDLRHVRSLGIPSDYEGNAVLGRYAELSTVQVQTLSVPALALALQRQLKPFTAEDAHTDISYLTREYDQGRIDEEGNYANFVIGAWLDCRDAGGLIVNDLRRLAAADLCFEEPPARMETLVSQDINMVSIYQNNDGTVTLHYVGERHTLSRFADCLNTILKARENDSNQTSE